MRAAQPYLKAVSGAVACARVHHSATLTSNPTAPLTSEHDLSADHLQLGIFPNTSYQYGSAHKPGTEFKDASRHGSYNCRICDFFGKSLYPAFYRHLLPIDGYTPLNSDFDSFYTRRFQKHVNDCFFAPVTGVPDEPSTSLTVNLKAPVPSRESPLEPSTPHLIIILALLKHKEDVQMW
ncbi:hypothetical protein EI94DRAFT_727488 [Lactarius quietus]|nr:hypothetical protein EI94DRAFT_727488 [Lactarius quietus]